MNRRRLICRVGLFILFTAVLSCSPLERRPLEKKYYDLTISTPRVQDADRCKGSPILIREFQIAPQFDSHAFTYKMSEKEYATDYYTEFVSYPAKLITDKFSEQICGTPYFSSIRASRQLDIQYRLSGKITQLFGDFQSPGHPKAVMAIQLLLEKRETHTFSIVHSRTYEAVIDIPTAEHVELAAGWSSGFTDIFRQFMDNVAPLL
jgi:hypothetical protein